MAISQEVIEPKLEERSKLQFRYVNQGNTYFRTLRFIENVSVDERQSSRLAEYNPVGRSGSLFSYLGATSRELTVNFNITLPNILEHGNYFDEQLCAQKTQEQMKEAYLKGSGGFGPVGRFLGAAQAFATTAISEQDQWLGVPSTIVQEEMAKYADLLSDREKLVKFQSNRAFDVSFNSFTGLGNLDDLVDVTPASDEVRIKAIRKIAEWTSLIRSSVLNNASNPTEGPPIIHLTHGLMYRDIPCIATSYNIVHDGNAGYDKKTLLPRIISVSMTLKEIRPSDNSKYRLRGWESMLGSPSQGMDPR